MLGEHPAVRACCAIGVPDVAQGEGVKAFVVARDATAADDELAQALIAHCQARLIKWSCPRDIEFRRSLPVTRFGKIDYRALTDEEKSRVTGPGRPAPVAV